jgi:hypothetical protein
MAPGTAPGEPGAAPAPVDAKKSVAAFGGNPTGRKSKFKLPAGTPEGDDERRAAERDRKAAARAVAAKLVEPPALPAAGEMPAGPLAAEGAAQIVDATAPVAEAFVAWTPEDVREFTDELVDLSEAKRLSDFIDAANEAKLPKSLVAEIEKDARYPQKCKAGFKTAVAATTAKWLNRSNVSAKNKEEAALIFFGGTILLQGRRLRQKLDELIVSAKEAEEADKKKAQPKGPLP